ncbi:MAG TPA: single-stranded DNA-binding protein [Pyrinomonadaceae bacterium]|nr:single-stranded DNA-binding protein [Pyrinomonadaceae bacterium]
MSANISILGNTGREVTLRYTEKGTPIASFPIASNSFKSSPEGRVKVTHWFNVVAFGKTAETIAEHVQKGTHLLIHGRLSFSPWSTENGEPRSGAEVSLFSFEFVGSNRSNGVEDSVEEPSEPDVPEFTGHNPTEPAADDSFVDQF